MFSTPLRMILATVSAVTGTYWVYSGNSIGWYLLLIAALLIYAHFRNGPVWLALHAANAGDVDRAASILSQVHNPNLLSSQHRAYFELTSGLIASAKDHDVEAEKAFRSALEHGLRTDNDSGIAEIVLAQLLAKRGAIEEARGFATRARARSCKPAIAQHIEQVANSLEPAA